jgi:signal peptidase I
MSSMLAPLAVLLWPILSIGLVLALRLASAIDVAFVARDEEERVPAGRAVIVVFVFLGAAACARLATQAVVVEAFRIPSGSMAPTLVIGDHVLVDKLRYSVGTPSRGDVVVFEQPCRPDTMFISRLVALGGDTVEVRCGIVYVNDAPLAAEHVDAECSFWDRDEMGTWEKRSCSTYRESLGGVTYETLHEPSLPERRREVVATKGPAGTGYQAVARLTDFPGLRPPSCSAYGLGGETTPVEGRIEPASAGDLGGPCAPQRHYVVPEGHAFVMGDNRDNSSDSRLWGPVPMTSITGRFESIWWSSGPHGIRWKRLGRTP